MSTNTTSAASMRDWIVFLAVPFFFSSNLIFGRGILGEVSPYTTAFLRWTGSFLVALPFMVGDWRACVDFILNKTLLWLTLGFLGMFICGGAVYWALEFTTAANATLIYTTSTLFILIIQRIFHGRSIQRRELIGMVIAFAGVAAIVLKGDVTQLLQINFNIGDLVILFAAFSFAVYSVLLRNDAAHQIASISLFGLIALSGALTLLPATIYEVATGGLLPTTWSAVGKIAGIIVFASVAAFYCFTHIVRVFGPATAGITLYTTPPVSILMAVFFLGEDFLFYHAIGIVLVIGGVVLSTYAQSSR